MATSKHLETMNQYSFDSTPKTLGATNLHFGHQNVLLSKFHMALIACFSS